MPSSPSSADRVLILRDGVAGSPLWAGFGMDDFVRRLADAVSIPLYDDAPWDWPDDLTDETLVVALKLALAQAMEHIDD